MTELETMQRARMYMEKLAMGINPIDDSTVPERDVINNVRLSRCFFYVADVLRQVIDNGGVNPPKKASVGLRRIPFSLPAEERGRFEFSEAPIPVSEVAKRINALIPEDMKNLSYAAIRDWLISLGMLEDVPDAEGKTKKVPTPAGERMGILSQVRNGRNGTYVVVLYDHEAQHFILDNIDAVVEFSVNGKKPHHKATP